MSHTDPRVLAPDDTPRPDGRGVGPESTRDVEPEAQTIFARWEVAHGRGDFGAAAKCRHDLLRIGYTITLGRPARLRRLGKGGDRWQP